MAKKGDVLHEFHVTNRRPSGPTHPMSFSTREDAQEYVDKHPEDDLVISEVFIPQRDED